MGARAGNGKRTARAELTNTAAGNPALTLSRLLSPRRLDPTTEYLACVVPAFELGRKAGLGSRSTSGEEDKLEPAWTFGAGTPSAVTLPVYYHWEFRTGAGDDFEALADKLKPRPVPEEAGKRPIDISQARVPGPRPAPGHDARARRRAARVRRQARRLAGRQTRRSSRRRSRKSSMRHGRRRRRCDRPRTRCSRRRSTAAGRPTRTPWRSCPQPPADPPAPAWLHELNLDPRHRAVAGLGTQVVQAQQEQLMASAWEQFGEIERINQMQRQAQLGRAVNTVYHAKHLARFGEDAAPGGRAGADTLVVGDGRDWRNGAGADHDTHAAVAKDFAVRHPGPGRVCTAPPLDELPQRGHRPLPGRAAAPIAILTDLNSDSRLSQPRGGRPDW